MSTNKLYKIYDKIVDLSITNNNASWYINIELKLLTFEKLKDQTYIIIFL